MDEDQRQLWCRGLPLTGERGLEVEEFSLLRGRQRRLRLLLALGLLGVLVLQVPLLLWVLALEQRLDEKGWVGLLLVALLVGLGLILPMVILLWWRARWLEAGLVKRDLVAGKALIFAAADETAEDAADPLLEARKLEVLPNSQLLLRRDGVALRPVEPAEIYEVTSPPVEAARFAVPKAWREEVGEDLAVERRRLSAAELSELSGHIRRLKRPPGTLIFFAAMFVVGLGGALLTRVNLSALPATEKVAGAFYGAALLFNAGLYLRDLRLARRLELDLENQWVVIFEEELDSRLTTVEVLPASAALWTEGGHPSTWRQRQRQPTWGKRPSS